MRTLCMQRTFRKVAHRNNHIPVSELYFPTRLCTMPLCAISHADLPDTCSRHKRHEKWWFSGVVVVARKSPVIFHSHTQNVLDIHLTGLCISRQRTAIYRCEINELLRWNAHRLTVQCVDFWKCFGSHEMNDPRNGLRWYFWCCALCSEVMFSKYAMCLLVLDSGIHENTLRITQNRISNWRW